jgi:hypothetical protein
MDKLPLSSHSADLDVECIFLESVSERLKGIMSKCQEDEKVHDVVVPNVFCLEVIATPRYRSSSFYGEDLNTESLLGSISEGGKDEKVHNDVPNAYSPEDRIIVTPRHQSLIHDEDLDIESILLALPPLSKSLSRIVQAVALPPKPISAKKKMSKGLSLLKKSMSKGLVLKLKAESNETPNLPSFGSETQGVPRGEIKFKFTNEVDVMTPRRQYIENLPLAVRRPLSKSLSRIVSKRKIQRPIPYQRGQSEGIYICIYIYFYI